MLRLADRHQLVPGAVQVRRDCPGNSIGQLQDPKLDTEIDRVAALEPNAQLKEWTKVDKNILENYLPALPLYYGASNFPIGKNLGHVINDVTQGMPEFTSIYIKQP